jgi:DNA-directed RNA polymerase specialized sigma24 family protein
MEAEAVELMHPRPVDRIGDGATDLVTELYRGHALGLMRLAVMMVGDRPTAEDVVQEAFFGLYRRWPHLRDRASALTYVRSSVLNGCRSALRRRRLSFRAEHLPPVWSAEAAAMVGEDRRQVMAALVAVDRVRHHGVRHAQVDVTGGRFARLVACPADEGVLSGGDVQAEGVGPVQA